MLANWMFFWDSADWIAGVPIGDVICFHEELMTLTAMVAEELSIVEAVGEALLETMVVDEEVIACA
jgi:hypothetical protein